MRVGVLIFSVFLVIDHLVGLGPIGRADIIGVLGLILIAAGFCLAAWGRSTVGLASLLVGAAILLLTTNRLLLVVYLLGVGIVILAVRAPWRVLAVGMGCIAAGVAAVAMGNPADVRSAVLAASLLVLAPAALIAVLISMVRARVMAAERTQRDHQQRVQDARDAERRAIARDMHDTVAHQMTAASLVSGSRLKSQDPEQLREALREVNERSRAALAELRVMLAALRDPLDDPVRFNPPQRAARTASTADALESHTSWLGTLGHRVEVHGRPVAFGPLLDSAETACSLFLQEALTNAGKYAATSEPIVVEFIDGGGFIRIVVTSAMPVRSRRVDESLSSGYGLVAIRQRVHTLGGRAAAGAQNDHWVMSMSLPTHLSRIDAS